MTIQSIPLSPIDYVFTGAGSQPITFVFCFPNQMDPQVLKKSLDETLDFFPILRSQLRKISEKDFEYFITEDELSIEVAESDLPFQESRKITEYITPVSSIEGKPLTKIRLTQNPQGSVLALSLSHALVDGFSYFHFLLSWAAICRGNPIFKPHLDRDAILSNLCPTSKKITAETIYSDCGLFYRDEPRDSLTEQPDFDRFFISEEEIESHRDQFKREHGVSLSRNDVITALLWKKYIPAWNQESGNPKTYITLPFDFRRVKSGLPLNYFGCAVCFATASANLEELLNVSAGELALLIRNSVSRIKNDFVLKSLSGLESLRRQDGLAAMEKLHLRHPDSGMIVTNLTRMPVRDIDFGSGPPISFLAYADVFSSAAILQAEQGVEVLVANPLRVNL